MAPSDFLAQDEAMMAQYHAQTLVLSDYIRFLIGPVLHLSIVDIEALMPRFVERYVTPCLYPQATDVLNDYQQRGTRLLIISATSEFIVKAVAKALGVADFLAIQLAAEDGFYNGDIQGIPTFREGKVSRLKQWLAEQNESLAGAYFYSDSMNDLPLLEQVEYPVATNPDPRLEVIATERNWPVLHWCAPHLIDPLSTQD